MVLLESDKHSHVMNDGIYYWWPAPGGELPDVKLPKTVASQEQLREYFDMDDPLRTKGASDSTWGRVGPAPGEIFVTFWRYFYLQVPMYILCRLVPETSY
jgi:hypothetical protein